VPSCIPAKARGSAVLLRDTRGYSAEAEIPEKPCHGFLEHPTRSTETPAPYFNPHGPTPGALQGDDYPLEYYHDGYPKLPACLDRRPKPLLEEAA